MARADKTDEQQVTRLQSPTDERRWYALCGTRLYVIATLMGRFPDMGGHEPGEMGGVWAPPVKLLDGYWLGLREESQGVNWLTEPSTWEMGPEGVILQYALPKLGLQMTRREWVIPDESVLVLDVSIEQMPGFELGREQTIECLFAARSDLRGVWLAEERLGWTNGEDIAEFDDTLGMVTVRDKEQPWAVCFGATEHPIAHQLGKDVWGPERTKGRGTGVILSYAARVSSMREARLRFVIAGSSAGHTGAQDLFSFARASRLPERLTQKWLRQRYLRN